MSTAWPQNHAMDGAADKLVYRAASAFSETTFNLSTGYVYGTSGRAVMLAAFISPETANLTDFWFKVKSYGAVWGSTDGLINWEIRHGLDGDRVPGTTLVASGTLALDGTTGWKRATGLTVALTAGKLYCLVIYDSDGAAGGYAVLAIRYASAADANECLYPEVGTTTNGFSTFYTETAGSPAVGLKIGSVTIAGVIHESVATVTSGTYRRGARFRPKSDCTLIGYAISTDVTQLVGAHTIELIADSEPPGGDTLGTWTPGASTIGASTTPIPNFVIVPAATRVDLTANTWYRLVVAPASAITSPRKVSLATAPDSTLLAAALPMSGEFHWTEDSSGSWLDETSNMPLFGPVLVPKDAAAASGGTGRRIVLEPA